MKIILLKCLGYFPSNKNEFPNFKCTKIYTNRN